MPLPKSPNIHPESFKFKGNSKTKLLKHFLNRSKIWWIYKCLIRVLFSRTDHAIKYKTIYSKDYLIYNSYNNVLHLKVTKISPACICKLLIYGLSIWTSKIAVQWKEIGPKKIVIVLIIKIKINKQIIQIRNRFKKKVYLIFFLLLKRLINFRISPYNR